MKMGIGCPDCHTDSLNLELKTANRYCQLLLPTATANCHCQPRLPTETANCALPMIPFFRKLRQSLLAENRLSRYLLYAFGEILLVVIGILLALQVNNWNEDRKFRAQQAGLLKDLVNDLEANLDELQDGHVMNSQLLSEYRSLMRAIREDQPASPAIDSLCLHLENWHSPFFTRTAYESLKNKGLEVIRNGSLKGRIISVYERSFMFLTDDYDRMEWDFAATVKTRLLNNYIQYEELDPRENDVSGPIDPLDPKAIQGEVRVAPVDFEAMKADGPFVNMLSQLIHNRRRGVILYSQVIAELESLIRDIQGELKTLEP